MSEAPLHDHLVSIVGRSMALIASVKGHNLAAVRDHVLAMREHVPHLPLWQPGAILNERQGYVLAAAERGEWTRAWYESMYWNQIVIHSAQVALDPL